MKVEVAGAVGGVPQTLSSTYQHILPHGDCCVDHPSPHPHTTNHPRQPNPPTATPTKPPPIFPPRRAASLSPTMAQDNGIAIFLQLSTRTPRISQTQPDGLERLDRIGNKLTRSLRITSMMWGRSIVEDALFRREYQEKFTASLDKS